MWILPRSLFFSMHFISRLYGGVLCFVVAICPGINVLRVAVMNGILNILEIFLKDLSAEHYRKGRSIL